MYHVFGTLLLAFSGASLTTANPTPLAPIDIATIAAPDSTTNSLHKRASTGDKIGGDIGGIYMCKEKGFQGECTYFNSPMGECWNFNDHWKNAISSFSPDETVDPFFNFNCTVFADAGCKGKSKTMVSPGQGDLSIIGAVVDNDVESWKCTFSDPKAQKLYDVWQMQE